MARPVVNLRNSLAAASPQRQGFPSRTQTWRPSNASTPNRRTSVLPTCSESPSMTRTAPEIIDRHKRCGFRVDSVKARGVRLVR
jgi:hypothetical protein